MTLSDRDREIVRRAAERIRNQDKPKAKRPNYNPPEPPARPTVFRHRCKLCGEPCRWFFCHEHSWARGDD